MDTIRAFFYKINPQPSCAPVIQAKSTTMLLANLISGNRALLASKILSSYVKLLSMERDRQTMKYKPIFFISK